MALPILGYCIFQETEFAVGKENQGGLYYGIKIPGTIFVVRSSLSPWLRLFIVNTILDNIEPFFTVPLKTIQLVPKLQAPFGKQIRFANPQVTVGLAYPEDYRAKTCTKPGHDLVEGSVFTGTLAFTILDSR